MQFEVTVRTRPTATTTFLLLSAEDEEDAITKAESGNWDESNVVFSETEPETLPLFEVVEYEATE